MGFDHPGWIALWGLSHEAERRARALAARVGAPCFGAGEASGDGAAAVLVGAGQKPGAIGRIRKAFPAATLLACGSEDGEEAALAEIRAGADDFLRLNGDADAAAERLRRHLARQGASCGDDCGFVGTSRAVNGIKALVRRLARSHSTTLIRGETGTGKELVALMLHRASTRAARPLVAINCAAIPETLIEGELFGYEKGSFSNALRSYPGKFRLADGGTLFLDEVGELSAAAQSKLLRAIESGEVFPIGAARPQRTDVRIIAATNLDLAAQVARGAFRADLFYRLAVIELVIPPLRDRREDIAPIARCLVERLCDELRLPPPIVTHAFLDVLGRHDWPGNVREMRNALEYALVTAERPGLLDPLDLPPVLGPAAEASPAPGEEIERERRVLLGAIARAGGKKAGAAKALNCSRMTLYRRLERAGLAEQRVAAVD
ncbi:MAG TPA: sigma-54 dependent transcriptional regulator [Allosphingosinicella sp.]|jgi:DNA-binding NtrC family response regulator